MAPEVGSSAAAPGFAIPSQPTTAEATASATGTVRPAELYEQIGPYRVLRVIGQGGMGTVYEGLRAGIERRVAIKILHPDLAAKPDARARLYREASAVNRVRHAGLAEVTEVEHLPDGSLYLVMEYLRGETLAARLQRSGGVLPLRAAVQLTLRLADILAAAHAHGVVHRDIKPSNIMLVPDSQMPEGERVKLIDFGIAKLASAALPTPDQTPQDTVLGTPDYMSPEQCSNRVTIDGKSDVYALGAVLFHVLVGRPPFVAATPRLVMAKHQLESAPSLSARCPQAPAALVTLVQRMLNKDPAQRPTSDGVIANLHDILAALSSPLPDQAPAAAAHLAPANLSQVTVGDTALSALTGPARRPLLWIAGGAALMLALGGMAWEHWARSSARPTRPQAVAPRGQATEFAGPASSPPTPTQRSQSAVADGHPTIRPVPPLSGNQTAQPLQSAHSTPATPRSNTNLAARPETAAKKEHPPRTRAKSSASNSIEKPYDFVNEPYKKLW